MTAEDSLTGNVVAELNKETGMLQDELVADESDEAGEGIEIDHEADE